MFDKKRHLKQLKIRASHLIFDKKRNLKQLKSKGRQGKTALGPGSQIRGGNKGPAAGAQGPAAKFNVWAMECAWGSFYRE